MDLCACVCGLRMGRGGLGLVKGNSSLIYLNREYLCIRIYSSNDYFLYIFDLNEN